jgi:tetratricopeptide (TPR) repeat protein
MTVQATKKRYQSASEVLQDLQPAKAPSSSPPKSESPSTNTSSQKRPPGYNYTKLRNLLANGQWKAADRQTLRYIIEMNTQDVHLCQVLDCNINLEKIPDRELREIDDLWVKYSNGRFGLSIQKEIYQRLVQPSEINKKRLQRFGNEIGWYENGKWKNYNKLNFSGDAPYGHLPAALWFNQDDWEGLTYRIIIGGLSLLFILVLPWSLVIAFLNIFPILMVLAIIYSGRLFVKYDRHIINKSYFFKNMQFLISLQITPSQTLASASQTLPSPSTATSTLFFPFGLRSQSTTEDYFERGDNLQKQGKYSQAVEAFTRAIKMNPHLAEPYFKRGLSYYYLEQYPKALSDYNQAIAINPDYAHAYYNKALIFEDLGDTNTAGTHFERAAELYQQQGNEEDYRDAMEQLEELD